MLANGNVQEHSIAQMNGISSFLLSPFVIFHIILYIYCCFYVFVYVYIIIVIPFQESQEQTENNIVVSVILQLYERVNRLCIENPWIKKPLFFMQFNVFNGYSMFAILFVFFFTWYVVLLGSWLSSTISDRVETFFQSEILMHRYIEDVDAVVVVNIVAEMQDFIPRVLIGIIRLLCAVVFAFAFAGSQIRDGQKDFAIFGKNVGGLSIETLNDIKNLKEFETCLGCFKNNSASGEFQQSPLTEFGNILNLSVTGKDQLLERLNLFMESEVWVKMISFSIVIFVIILSFFKLLVYMLSVLIPGEDDTVKPDTWSVYRFSVISISEQIKRIKDGDISSKIVQLNSEYQAGLPFTEWFKQNLKTIINYVVYGVILGFAIHGFRNLLGDFTPIAEAVQRGQTDFNKIFVKLVEMLGLPKPQTIMEAVAIVNNQFDSNIKELPKFAWVLFSEFRNAFTENGDVNESDMREIIKDGFSCGSKRFKDVFWSVHNIANYYDHRRFV